MNAPFRILTAEQVTAAAVLEQALRSTHGIEVLLHDVVGTVAYQAKRAVVTDATRNEARELARLFLLHADALTAVANGEDGFATAHPHTLAAEARLSGEGGRG